MALVYIIICSVNNKKYIGCTGGTLKSRKNSHKKDLNRSIKNNRRNTVLYNAMRKYGWETFNWEIIFEHTDFEYVCKIKEPEFIKQLNSHFREGWGYNMTYGGEGRKGTIPWNKGKKGLQVAWNKGIKCPHNNTSNKEVRNKMMINNPNRKEVEQLSLSGELINTYPSIREAARKTGMSRDRIALSIKKSIKPYKFIWKLKNN